MLQDLGKLSVQYCVTTIVELQQQQRLLISGGWLEIQLSLLNILLVHIKEETLYVKMTLWTMNLLKVPMDCSQSLSTWHGKLLLLKAVLEVTGIDSVLCYSSCGLNCLQSADGRGYMLPWIDLLSTRNHEIQMVCFTSTGPAGTGKFASCNL